MIVSQTLSLVSLLTALLVLMTFLFQEKCLLEQKMNYVTYLTKSFHYKEKRKKGVLFKGCRALVSIRLTKNKRRLFIKGKNYDFESLYKK